MVSVDLMQWVLEQHKEIVERSKLSVERTISFSELNTRMAEYAGNYAWAIAENAIADSAYQRKYWEFEQWKNPLFVKMQSELPTGAAVKKIETTIMAENEREWEKWHKELLLLEQQKRVREQFLKVWGALKDIYVELARNMRSDYQASNSLIVGKTSVQGRLDKIRKARRLADGS